MYSWFYRGSDLVTFPLIGMFIFIAVFTGVLIHTFRKSQRKEQADAAALPLAGDDDISFQGTATTGARHGH